MAAKKTAKKRTAKKKTPPKAVAAAPEAAPVEPTPAPAPAAPVPDLVPEDVAAARKLLGDVWPEQRPNLAHTPKAQLVLLVEFVRRGFAAGLKAGAA